jgi:hypothetical protein
MMRLDLGCLFRDQPINFVTTTATSLGEMKRPDALTEMNLLWLENSDSLWLRCTSLPTTAVAASG